MPAAGTTSSKCQSKLGQAATEESKEPATDGFEHEFAASLNPPGLALQTAFLVQSQFEWSEHQPFVFLGHLQQLKVCLASPPYLHGSLINLVMLDAQCQHVLQFHLESSRDRTRV